MQFPRRTIAWLLLTLWLPAVLHCRLEAVGAMFGTECCAETHAPADDHCAGDACDTIEGAFANSTTVFAKAPTPLWCVTLLTRVASQELTLVFSAPVKGVIEAATAPPEMVHSRHFLTRTALPPRAPDRIS